MTIPTHITTSGGLISAAFIENVRETGSRQRGIEPASFALPWSPAPKSPAAMEETIATAWELLLERWDIKAFAEDVLAYILDTFPIVRRKDEERYGEYWTKRLVLENYDTMQCAGDTGQPLPDLA